MSPLSNGRLPRASSQAIERREGALERASQPLRGNPGDTASLSVGADAIESGVNETVLKAVAEDAPRDRRTVAIMTLTQLVQQGDLPDAALAKVRNALKRGPDALTNLPSEGNNGNGRGRGSSNGQGQGNSDGRGGYELRDAVCPPRNRLIREAVARDRTRRLHSTSQWRGSPRSDSRFCRCETRYVRSKTVVRPKAYQLGRSPQPGCVESSRFCEGHTASHSGPRAAHPSSSVRSTIARACGARQAEPSPQS